MCAILFVLLLPRQGEWLLCILGLLMFNAFETLVIHKLRMCDYQYTSMQTSDCY